MEPPLWRKAICANVRWQQSAQSPQGLLKYWARISTFMNLSGTTTMKEAIQLRWEHLTLLQTAGSLQGSRLQHFYSESWKKKCAPGTQWSTWRLHTEVRKSQQTLSLDIKDGVSTLGLLWHPATDQLQVKDNSASTSNNSTASTKRNVLTRIASNLTH